MSNAHGIQHWLDEYGESHRNATNELIHWICVPVIFFCVIGLLASIPTPTLPLLGPLPIAKLAVGLVLYFYLTRSLTLMVGMALWCVLCLWLASWLDTHAPWPLWAICLVLFTLAWIGQFIGHHIEGKKPSFLRDIQFLLIGPAWLMAKIYAKLGIKV
jgi:uncharacterized membrane protein YGL010W